MWIRILSELRDAISCCDIGETEDRDSELEEFLCDDELDGLDRGQKVDVSADELKRRKAKVLQYYWASHQRFFRAMCVAVKVNMKSLPSNH